MESLLLDIVNELRQNGHIDAKTLESIVRQHNKNLANNASHRSKKQLLPYYLEVKRTDPVRWHSWRVDEELEKKLIQALRMKPGRTASGVATVTVLTKPWKCASNCLYCPNDIRMPKSYLSDEPACQRAERSYFDPYLQVSTRLRTLMQMGHVTDKVELIVLGGTWSDYPESYQIWFVKELFRALNEASDYDLASRNIEKRRLFYRSLGLSNCREDLKAAVEGIQQRVQKGNLTYNEAVDEFYGTSKAWTFVSQRQCANFDELEFQHTVNEKAQHRVVGLVIETRPDTVTCENLTLIRRLGCTKVQTGIQSLDSRLLKLNCRNVSVERIQEALALLRLFGFKTHIHFMANLCGATPEDDKRDYERLVTQASYCPDEIKLYPCALVDGTGLCSRFAEGTWRPYTEEELLDVLSSDVLCTPAYTRISRMIRDISAHDILVGNKKVNLRQLVEQRAEHSGKPIAEIRHREIGSARTDIRTLRLSDVAYDTTVSHEHFLQWITNDGHLAGFLRLSLPHKEAIERFAGRLPIQAHEAMIREVHIYGRVAGLHQSVKGAQHLGLGKRLVETACTIAYDAGYTHINVISSVGTREYYRSLGFYDNALYQQRKLLPSVKPAT